MYVAGLQLTDFGASSRVTLVYHIHINSLPLLGGGKLLHGRTSLLTDGVILWSTCVSGTH